MRKAARIGAALVLVGAGGAPALAQEGVFMRDLLGQAGLIAKPQADIDYRERAPLVVPPRLELREPGTGGGAQSRGPQWPNDPDAVAARGRQAEARTPVTELERRRANDPNPRLSPAELRGGLRPGAGVEARPEYRSQGNGRDGTWVNPDTLRRQGHASLEAQGRTAEGQEPERRLLSEPPSGLRKPTGKAVAANSDPVSVDRERENSSPFAFFRQITGD